MNYNNFRMVGKRLNFLSLKRRLHDSKLPFITSSYRNPEVVEWIGVESPRKADASWQSTLVNTESNVEVPPNTFVNKTEYDDEYTSAVSKTKSNINKEICSVYDRED